MKTEFAACKLMSSQHDTSAAAGRVWKVSTHWSGVNLFYVEIFHLPYLCTNNSTYSATPPAPIGSDQTNKLQQQRSVDGYGDREGVI